MKYEDNKRHEECEQTAAETIKPSLYQVVVHNDDFTPMEFVVGILERFFYMNRSAAVETMLKAHITGRAICGIYSRDVAESKRELVVTYAAQHEFPLLCSLIAES